MVPSNRFPKTYSARAETKTSGHLIDVGGCTAASSEGRKLPGIQSNGPVGLNTRAPDSRVIGPWTSWTGWTGVLDRLDWLLHDALLFRLIVRAVPCVFVTLARALARCTG